MAAHLAQPLTITTTAVTNVRGGRYVWAASATWDGGTVTLQALDPNGTTYTDVTNLTANGGKEVLVGEGSTLKLSVVTATDVASTLSMIGES